MPSPKLLTLILCLPRRKKSQKRIVTSNEQPSSAKKSLEPLSQIQSPLFRLPVEIRLLIYQHALTSSIIIFPRTKRFRPCRYYLSDCTSVFHTGLLTTCQRIYSEALETHHTYTTFHIWPPRRGNWNVISIESSWWLVIRSLTLSWVPCERDWKEFEALCKTLRELTPLRRLHVRFDDQRFPGDGRHELKLLDKIDEGRGKRVDITVEAPEQWMHEREVREWRGGGRVREGRVTTRTGDDREDRIREYRGR